MTGNEKYQKDTSETEIVAIIIKNYYEDILDGKHG